MTGPVEWAALVFLCSLMVGCLGLAWRARGAMAALEIRYEVKFAELEKDVRHNKANTAQHAIINSEMREDVAVLKSQVERHARLLNGGPHK